MTAHRVVLFCLVVGGLGFLFAGIKHAFVGGSVNAAFVAIGIAFLVIGVVINRKPAVPPPAA